MNHDDVVILAGSRTPQGKIKGQLASLSAVQLGTIAMRSALKRSGVDASAVNAVIFGQVLQAGAGQNPARQSAIAAGLTWNTPAVTVNKVCLSGLAAIVDAARLLRSGEAEVVMAGGQESMTNAPHVMPGSRMGWSYGTMPMLDTAAHDGLTDAFDHDSMGSSTERFNTKLGIGREEQDQVAAWSHQRAGVAQAAGVFEVEIAPVTIPQRKGDPVVLTADEGVRPDSTLQTLARLKPAFAQEGTITAGNSSPLSDGAAALVLTTRDYAEKHNLEWLAVLGAPGEVAGPDNSLHSQPSHALSQALSRSEWRASDLDFVEINEAFAAVSLHSSRELGLPLDIVNIHGGAIAIGHPIGASGARLALHAAHELKRRGTGKAGVSLCGGGGQGEALLLWR